MIALGDRFAALVLLLLSLYTIAAARDMSYMRGRIPGPGFAPFWIGLSLAVASIAILVGSRRQQRPAHEAEAGERHDAGSSASVVVAVAAVTVAAVALIGPLGIVAALALMLVIMTRLLGADWRTSVATAVALPVALHLVFGVWLKVPLPRGPWGF